MIYGIVKAATLLGCCAVIAACGNQSAESTGVTAEPALPISEPVQMKTATVAKPQNIEKQPELEGFVENLELTTIISASEIPYPVYPNGIKYRIGGENGLKLVLFQTEDSFETVDRYFRLNTGSANMPRLMAMSDYVKYTTDPTDADPWGTTKAGIVIHEFNNDSERSAIGASPEARTNIIMSY